jgi:MFS family permease
LNDAEAGSLFIAQFTGVMIGSALSSLMIERLGSLRLMAFSYAATAAAVACLGVNAWGLGLLSVLSYGCAIGLTAPATNLLVAEINSERRAVALNILSFVWTLGAVVGSPLIVLFARAGRLVRPLIGLAALLSVIALLIARRALMDLSSGLNQPKPDQKDPPPFERSALRAWVSPYALLTGGDRVWNNDAVILPGGTADWQSRRAGSFEARARGGCGVDQPVRGGRRYGDCPGGN